MPSRDLAAGSMIGVDAAAGGAGAGVAVAAGFWARWGTVIHWVVAGGAEFLAVFIPAMVAAGGAAAVMAQGVGDAYDHLMAMYDDQAEALDLAAILAPYGNVARRAVAGLGHTLQP